MTPPNPPQRGPRGTAAARRNTTYYDGDLHRDLLDAALLVIATAGPSALTLRSLARDLGVSHAAPANHFPGKTALFTAIAVEGFDGLTQAMQGAVGLLAESAEGTERLRATGRAYAGYAVEHRAHFEVMWRDDLLDTSDAQLVVAGAAAFDQLAVGVQHAQEQGWAAGRDPRTVAYLAWSVAHGLAALWLNGPLAAQEARSFDQVVDAVIELLTTALDRH